MEEKYWFLLFGLLVGWCVRADFQPWIAKYWDKKDPDEPESRKEIII